jgi:hypothetical protein
MAVMIGSQSGATSVIAAIVRGDPPGGSSWRTAVGLAVTSAMIDPVTRPAVDRDDEEVEGHAAERRDDTSLAAPPHETNVAIGAINIAASVATPSR